MTPNDKVKDPDCYGWFDKADPPCLRCAIMEKCSTRQAKIRPECFGELHDNDNPECAACLDNSRCTEEQMSPAKIRIKRMATPVADVEPDEELVEQAQEEQDEAEEVEPLDESDAEELTEEPEEDAEEQEEEGSPYDDLSLEDLRGELTARKLETAGRKSVLIERLIEDDEKPAPKPVAPAAKPTTKPAVAAKPIAKPVVAPKATPKPAASAAPVAKQVVKPAAPVKPIAKPVVAPKEAPKLIPQPEPEPEPEPEPVATFTSSSLADLLNAMAGGSCISITKVSAKEWVMSMADANALAHPASKEPAKETKAKKLSWADFEVEVYTPEFYDWLHKDCGSGKAWSDMTQEEKVAFADEMGATYAKAADNRVTMLNLFRAVETAMGIKKYKPGYEKAAARNALR